MVTTTETTTIITQPKLRDSAQPSFKRWLKHFCYMPATKRYFSQQDQFHIAQAVQQAEQGHVGEIQVVIEGHFPLSQAYRQTAQLRAQQLFAELGVWDTALNSGVLLYINLCERAVEIVIDRGLHQATQSAQWQEICQNMVEMLKSQQYRPAVVEGGTKIGELVSGFYDNCITKNENELPNHPIIL